MHSDSKDADRYPFNAEVVEVMQLEGMTDAAATTRLLRARSFMIAWSVCRGQSGMMEVDSEEEYFVLLPDVSASLTVNGKVTKAPVRSVCIMPAGRSSVELEAAGECIRIFRRPPAPYVETAAFGTGHLQASLVELREVSRKSRNAASALPAVHVLDDLPNSVGMPRAKLFQTSTMSINWVDYFGPRDRKVLSPHSHGDFEQASIAIEGQFVHHFRTSWGRDADLWRTDAHVEASSKTVALIPPPIIHTTEGIGAGRQILIDVFAPARDDFIAKGQVLNASDYR